MSSWNWSVPVCWLFWSRKTRKSRIQMIFSVIRRLTMYLIALLALDRVQRHWAVSWMASSSVPTQTEQFVALLSPDAIQRAVLSMAASDIWILNCLFWLHAVADGVAGGFLQHCELNCFTLIAWSRRQRRWRFLIALRKSKSSIPFLWILSSQIQRFRSPSITMLKMESWVEFSWIVLRHEQRRWPPFMAMPKSECWFSRNVRHGQTDIDAGSLWHIIECKPLDWNLERRVLGTHNPASDIINQRRVLGTYDSAADMINWRRVVGACKSASGGIIASAQWAAIRLLMSDVW